MGKRAFIPRSSVHTWQHRDALCQASVTLRALLQCLTTFLTITNGFLTKNPVPFLSKLAVGTLTNTEHPLRPCSWPASSIQSLWQSLLFPCHEIHFHSQEVYLSTPHLRKQSKTLVNILQCTRRLPFTKNWDFFSLPDIFVGLGCASPSRDWVHTIQRPVTQTIP